MSGDVPNGYVRSNATRAPVMVLIGLVLGSAGCHHLSTGPSLVTAAQRATEKRQIKQELTRTRFPSPGQVGL